MTPEEFERKVQEVKAKLARSEEWCRKKRERDAFTVLDMTPWMPKNVTQAEIDDWSANNIEHIDYIRSVFKNPCQQEQVLREIMIIHRDSENDLKRHYRSCLKRFLNLTENETKRRMKDIESKNPDFFKMPRLENKEKVAEYQEYVRQNGISVCCMYSKFPKSGRKS